MRQADSTFRPVFAPGPTIQKDKMIFLLSDKTLTVCIPRELSKKLVKLCDGTRTYNQVITELDAWDGVLVNKFLQDLISRGVLLDSFNLNNFFWSFVKNPTRFFKNLSDQEIVELVKKAHLSNRKKIPKGAKYQIPNTTFSRMLNERRSTRVFSNEQVKAEKILAMLWAGYGVVRDPLLIDKVDPQRIKAWQSHRFSRHTVPSAGALYPLRLHACLFRDCIRLDKGIYEARFRSPSEVELVQRTDDPSPAIRAFADDLVMNDAQGTIIISGSFDQSAEKYTNRSALYIPLEAGHVAQNVHLAAVEQKVQTVEIGGFLEDSMRLALKLPDAYWPLITILFGFEGKISPKSRDLIKGLEVNWSGGVKEGYKLPFSMAFARLEGSSGDWSCGRSVDPEIALMKARSEAIEWDASSRFEGRLFEASFEELQHGLKPQSIIAYHPRQYLRAGFPFAPFDPKKIMCWVKGSEVVSGQSTYILADCTFFPYKLNYKPYTSCSSSGTAVHLNRDQAIESAVLELIERDAFMLYWLIGAGVPRIPHCSLPSDVVKRINNLKRLGFQVSVRNLTIDFLPVILVFAQNVHKSFTTCAAASNYDAGIALDHALQEVESAVFTRMGFLGATTIVPKNVHFTDDHGYLYEQPKYFRRADFLLDSSKVESLGSINQRNKVGDWQKLLTKIEGRGLRLYVVDLSSKDSSLHAVRAFVPGLIPMTFGFGVEPKGIERIYSTPVSMGLCKSTPHYGELQSFPHPYT